MRLSALRPRAWAAALMFALALSAGRPCARAQYLLDAAETEVLVDLVLDSPGYRDWTLGAGEAERAATRVQLIEWIRNNPQAAGHLFSGFLIDERFPSSRFRERFQQILRERTEHFRRPESAVRALEEAAAESAALPANFHLSEDEIRTWTKQIFEKESDKGVLTGFTVRAQGSSTAFFPETGLRLNPAAFRDIFREVEARLRELQAGLEEDRLDLERGPLKAAGLQSSIEQRDAYVRKAREALAAFTDVLARRPEAVRSLTSGELKALQGARSEAGRQLALAALAAREFNARLQVEKLRGSALEQAIEEGPAGQADKAAYRETLGKKAGDLEQLAGRWARLRRLLEASDYASRLPELRRGLAEAERLSRALEPRARLAHSIPYQLHNAHQKNRLSWLARLWRWFVATFLPRSRWAEAYRRGESAESSLAAAFRSIASGGI